MGQVRQVLKTLTDVIGEIDPSTPLGKAVTECIVKLSKVAPAAEANPQAAMQQQKQQIMQMQQQMPAALMQRSMASQAQPPGPAAVAPSPGG